MERSKLISSMIARLRVAYPSQFKDYDEEMLLGLVKLYQDSLASYRSDTIVTSIDEIIKESKFMPTIAEIIERCEKNRFIYENEILEKMNNVGYFKNTRELKKAYNFLEKKVIPEWFYEDMKKYGFIAYKSITDTSDSSTLINKKFESQKVEV